MNTLLTVSDIEYLRMQQSKLDGDIIEKSGITHDEWMYDFKEKHHLALKVEVHEFINECHDQFKYWKKKPINKECIIDEAVDVLHFVCLHWNKGSKSSDEIHEDVAYRLKLANEGLHKGSTEQKLATLSTLEDKDSILAFTLSVLDDYNFTVKDIIEQYKRKNAINFERLEEGY